MGTTADKLNAVLASKNAIRDAITEKIGEPAGEVMSTYAEKIRGIRLEPEYFTTTLSLKTTITAPSEIGTITDAGAIEKIKQNSHRYLAKKTADGEVTICQLDDNDSNYYSDGEIADLTGKDGDVFMKLPVFWYKLDSSRMTLLYGTQPYGEEWKKWDDNQLIGVYKAVLQNDKLYSISDAIPSGGLSYNSAKNYVSNRGLGYSLIKLGHHAIMANLFLFWYRNTNSQQICGKGLKGSAIQNGATNVLGMEDTTPNNGDGKPINFWGLENWWGCKYEIIDNCILTSGSYFGITNDPYIKDGTYSIDSASGYKSRYSLTTGIITYNESASGTTGMCDGCVSGSANNILSRTRDDQNQMDGVFSLDASIPPTQTHYIFGTRIAFAGNVVQVNNSKDFKNITILE